MVFLGDFVAQTRDVMFARARNNVVFVRERYNLFDPSCVKVGLRGQVCIHCLEYLEARVASIIIIIIADIHTNIDAM